MKTITPDLFDGTPAAPAAQPLRNRRRETYCQLLAGECHDNQTEAYARAFGIANRDAASAAAARLNRHPEVSARIARLREEAIARMGVDRLYILAKRKYIAEHARSMDARLRALSDLETSLGLDTPQRIDISHTGQIGIEHSGGMIAISDPAAFARAMEAIRAAREANRSAAAPKKPLIPNLA